MKLRLLRLAALHAAREDKTIIPAVQKKLSAEFSKTTNRTQDKNEP